MKLSIAVAWLLSSANGQAPPAAYQIQEFKNNLGATQFQFGSTGELVSKGAFVSSAGTSKLADLNLSGALVGKDATLATLGVANADVTGTVTAKALGVSGQVTAATFVGDSLKVDTTVTTDKVVAGEYISPKVLIMRSCL